MENQIYILIDIIFFCKKNINAFLTKKTINLNDIL